MTPRALLVAALMLFACAAAPEEELPLDGADDSFLDGKADSLIDGAGVLALANRLSAGELTDVCRLHSIAAGSIVTYRDDHGPYADLETLDAVPYVGPRAFDSLGRCWDLYYKDQGEGAWRTAFGLPEGDIALAANLIIPGFESGDWAQIDRSIDEVLDDPQVELRSVIEHGQCELRGKNPGRVWLDCRRRATRPGLLAGSTYLTRDRKWFTVRAEVAADGSFAGARFETDGYEQGERHYLQVGGRLEADRTIRLTTWKYYYVTPYGDGWVQQLLQDLAWGADEASARFRDGSWDRFDEVTGETVALPGGTSRQPCAGIAGTYTWWAESGCEDGQRVEEVAPFELDAHEVTWAAYSGCVQEGKCSDPCGGWQSYENCVWNNGHQFYAADTHPATGLLGAQASDFCSWAGKRLPSSAEWNLAAGGTGRRTYPWGEAAPSCARTNHAGCRGATDTAGSHPSGATPEGVHDLAGNAAEYAGSIRMDRYTSNGWQGTDFFTELRGGSFSAAAAGVRVDRREARMVSVTSTTVSAFAEVGFRCAR